MRTRNLFKVSVFATIVVVFCVFGPAIAIDDPNWGITQITDNGYDDTNPQISGPNVVWEGGGMIYFYDGTDAKWIGGSSGGTIPQVSLNNTVWQFNDGADDEISYNDGISTTQLTVNGYHDRDPQISGNNVVWASDELGSNNTQIMLYDSDATQTLANPGHDNMFPQISGENVVWRAQDLDMFFDKIFYYDGSSIHQLTNNFADYDPQISGNNVTWQGYGTSSTEIFYCEAPYGSIKQLTNNTVEDETAQISGSTVVWHSRVPEIPWPYQYEVYMCDASDAVPTPVKLVGKLDGRYPQVSGSNVAWQSRENELSDWEIFLYDGAADEIIQLTDNAVDDSFPQISGNNVVWQGLVDDGFGTYYYQIFLAEKLFAEINVSPESYSFNQIPIGVRPTTIITIANDGNKDLTVDSAELTIGSDPEFDIVTALTFPRIIEGGTNIEIEIEYAPESVENNTAVLEIVSDDEDEGLVQVPLDGAGYIPDPPDPDEQIQDIIDFFDDSVDNGTLVSAGPKKALDQFKNSLLGVQGSIIDEDWSTACKDLYSLYVKSDGIPRPPDPIEGPAIPVLSGMIETLLTTMNCTQLD